MWLAAISNEADAVEQLGEKFDVSLHEVKQDFEEFVKERCERDQLCGTTAEGAKQGVIPVRPRLPLSMLAWWSLFTCQRALNAGRFQEVYCRAASYKKPAPGGVTGEMRDTIRQAFRRAETFMLLKSAPRDCLPRSLALYQYLSLAGVRVNHHIGVERFPFNAHAWVDDDEGPWFDDKDYVDGFTILASL